MQWYDCTTQQTVSDPNLIEIFYRDFSFIVVDTFSSNLSAKPRQQKTFSQLQLRKGTTIRKAFFDEENADPTKELNEAFLETVALTLQRAELCTKNPLVFEIKLTEDQQETTMHSSENVKAKQIAQAIGAISTNEAPPEQNRIIINVPQQKFEELKPTLENAFNNL